MSQRIYTLLIVAVLAVGIWARADRLAWHFTHVDDIGVAKTILEYHQEGANPLFAVATHWTYSPFQFFFTPFLVSLDQSYRSLLFWGRFPSLIFSILGLLTAVLFYWRWKGRVGASCLVTITWMACSLEWIIFAKQMHNYAA
ncbi:MAG: hypothetical protein KC713_01740, partial [Candidatus Omnitrophica bacterium]|nr:hypothetical protein [Candidatus Omnitrophota bacterium]